MAARSLTDAPGATKRRRAPLSATARLPRQSEASWQATVVQYAKMRGWRIYHTHDSRHSAKGFPDLVLVRRPRILFAELKREDKFPTDDQRAWLDDLAASGQAAFVWRPSDWLEVQRLLT